MHKSKWYYLSAAALLALVVFSGNRAQADGDRFYSDLIRLDKVVTKINENYVEPVTSAELVDAAISGIRGILDPHTSYFDAKDYEDLKISTDGEFGGLGIQIGVRDQVLTVIAPLAGTPAARLGLRAGDQIVKIDTVSTRGITVDAAVDKLRGKAGTSVTLQIRREGVPDPLAFTITREIIKIESVPYAAMLNDSVAYVKVTQFARLTGEDLERKLKELKKANPRMNGLVLDLRMNPGGLLNQAIEVSELFVGKDRMVVFTKGRVKSQDQEYKSGRDPLWTGRMTVLINEGSASAAEIVSGAIQDWDRGVVLGENSYGKGSVQTILPMEAGSALKLTTAYYYTPAGRCINKPENGVKFKLAQDSLDDTGSAAKAKDTVWFHTKAGRKVLAAGGITPDVNVPDPEYSRFATELYRKSLFFNFIVKKRAAIAAKGPITPGFAVTPELLSEFRAFAFADTSVSRFRSASALALDQARDAWKRERKSRGDTTDAVSQAAFDKAYADMDAVLKAQNAGEFAANEPLIKRELKAELLGAVLGEDARTAFELSQDTQVAEAVRYLGDAKLYAKTLKAK